MAASSRFAGRMAASDADRVIRQALASLPTSHLETALASLSAGDLGKATAADRAHVLHTIGLVEDALEYRLQQDAIRAFSREV